MEDYLRSQLRAELRPSQQASVGQMTDATRMLEKSQEMYEVEAALESQKEAYQAKMVELRQREEALRERELTLQESLLKFDGPLQELSSKRERNERKAATEKKQKQQLEEAAAKLREEIEKRKKDKERMQALYESLLPYSRYLEGVLSASEDFEEVSDIIQRINTLVETRTELLKDNEKLEKEVERFKAEEQRFVAARKDKALWLQVQVVEGTKSHEQQSETAVSLMTSVEKQKEEEKMTTTTIGQSQLAVHNLLARVLQRRPRLVTDFPEDSVKQLDVVGAYMQNEIDIIEKMRDIYGYSPPEEEASSPINVASPLPSPSGHIHTASSPTSTPLSYGRDMPSSSKSKGKSKGGHRASNLESSMASVTSSHGGDDLSASMSHVTFADM